jgi:hypothetical protein
MPSPDPSRERISTRPWVSFQAADRDIRATERLCYAVGAALIAFGVFHLAVFAVDGGSWNGPVSWRKPTTFGVSFGATLLTLTWVSSHLTIDRRARRRWLVVLMGASILEVALIAVQAWRRVPSHFNLETTFDAVVARALAGGGAALIVSITGLAVIAFRRGNATPASLLLAVRCGFVSLLGSLAIGAFMIGRGVSTADEDQSAAYSVAGYLKPAHAITLHAILVLPALARLALRTRWSAGDQLRLVHVSIAGYALLAGVVLASAIGRQTPTDNTFAVVATAAGVSTLTGVAAALGLRCWHDFRTAREVAEP